MNTVLGIFNASFPLEDNRRVQFLHSLIISLGVVAAIFYFKPLGMADVTLPVIKLVPVYIGFGLINLLACMVADRVVRPAFPTFFDDQQWTVLKHIGWTICTILIISLGNIFFSRLLGFIGISGRSLLAFEFNVFIVSILPVTVITLIRQRYLLTVNLKKVRLINNCLSKPLTGSVQEDTLVFVSDNGQDTLKIQADQFFYAESSDTYTDIVYVETGIVRRALIRTSLKRIEEMNAATYLIRVHRAFLVNMRKVILVTGNAQGYRLVFENIDESVPVSRRLSTTVHELLSKIHGC